MSKLVLSIICVLFLSPLAVFLKRGASNEFWINLILYLISASCLGTIHGLWVIWREE